MTIEFKKASKYDINIRHTDNGGCIGKIGCCEMAFSTPEEMIEALTEYYKDPKGLEKQYNNSGCTPEGVMETEAPIAGSAVGHTNRELRGPSIRETNPDRRREDPQCETDSPDPRRMDDLG